MKCHSLQKGLGREMHVHTVNYRMLLRTRADEHVWEFSFFFLKQHLSVRHAENIFGILCEPPLDLGRLPIRVTQDLQGVRHE